MCLLAHAMTPEAYVCFVFFSIFPTVSSQYFNVHFTILIVSDTHYFKIQNAVDFVFVAVVVVVVCRLLWYSIHADNVHCYDFFCGRAL